MTRDWMKLVEKLFNTLTKDKEEILFTDRWEKLQHSPQQSLQMSSFNLLYKSNLHIVFLSIINS